MKHITPSRVGQYRGFDKAYVASKSPVLGLRSLSNPSSRYLVSIGDLMYLLKYFWLSKLLQSKNPQVWGRYRCQIPCDPKITILFWYHIYQYRFFTYSCSRYADIYWYYYVRWEGAKSLKLVFIMLNLIDYVGGWFYSACY